MIRSNKNNSKINTAAAIAAIVSPFAITAHRFASWIPRRTETPMRVGARRRKNRGHLGRRDLSSAENSGRGSAGDHLYLSSITQMCFLSRLGFVRSVLES